ncbi:MAG: hypothetical protein GY856_51345, partial [bacterium]|nr:hypothetical protein [bacterium]
MTSLPNPPTGQMSSPLDPPGGTGADGRQKKLLEILEETLALPRDERPGFLDERCRGDAELRRDVDRLLAAHDAEGAEEFMEAPAFSLDPNVGRHFGPYELVRRLDRGGMGSVYL